MNPLLKKTLQDLAKLDRHNGIKQKFEQDSERVNRFGFELGELYFDFSKTHISHALLEAYDGYALDVGFVQARQNLFSGEKINTSEDRSVLHTLLRNPENQGIEMRDNSLLEQAASARQQFFKKYAAIQANLADRSVPVRDIIHVGIGGSSLGTQLLFESLVELGESINIHFIGNIDAHQLVTVLDTCDVNTTLVIGVSKTFTTAETLQNLNSIGQWFADNGVANWRQCYYAVTANPENAKSFGIAPGNVVSFPQWVGGRYSVWSSVSLSAALVLGLEKFTAFLAGAALVDQHFYEADPSHNICFIAAALDHYYGNFMDARSRAIFAYDYRLRSLVDYLQQLETESNGKDRQRDGSPVDQQTSPVVWGGVGTDVQHSVFQMLHQGTLLIPSEFILVKTADHSLNEHHKELLANGLAQTAALLAGQSLSEVQQIHADENLSAQTLKAKVFSGDRPSTTILLDRLTPSALGAMLAFYEHRTFCGGVFANINSYDQMGVELGKRLARQVKPRLEDAFTESSKTQAQKSVEGFDHSTLDLIKRVLR